MSCCRGNPISQPVSPSPLPLSPCEDDEGLDFLFLHLQLHPAAAQDVAQQGTPRLSAPAAVNARSQKREGVQVVVLRGRMFNGAGSQGQAAAPRASLASDWAR